MGIRIAIVLVDAALAFMAFVLYPVILVGDLLEDLSKYLRSKE